MKNLLTLLFLSCLCCVQALALNSLDEVSELYLVGDCSPTTWESVVADNDGCRVENGLEMPIELTSTNGDKDN